MRIRGVVRIKKKKGGFAEDDALNPFRLESKNDCTAHGRGEGNKNFLAKRRRLAQGMQRTVLYRREKGKRRSRCEQRGSKEGIGGTDKGGDLRSPH